MLTRLVAFLFLASTALGQSVPFFIQGSDPQFGMFTKDKDFKQETANFEFFVSNVNRLKPLFAVVCGDLTNANSPTQIAEYRRIAGKVDPSIKLYSVAGNHDVGNEPTPESLALYRKNFGPDWYSFRAPGIYGIVLDTNILKAPAKVQSDVAKQEAWLKQELVKAKSSGLIVVVFQHIPWFLLTADEDENYFNIPLATRATYLKMFADADVHYAFAGHYHRNALGSAGSLMMVTTGPVGMPIGPDPSGFRIVSVHGTELQQEYISLGKIPNSYPPPPPEK